MTQLLKTTSKKVTTLKKNTLEDPIFDKLNIRKVKEMEEFFGITFNNSKIFEEV